MCVVMNVVSRRHYIPSDKNHGCPSNDKIYSDLLAFLPVSLSISGNLNVYVQIE